MIEKENDIFKLQNELNNRYQNLLHWKRETTKTMQEQIEATIKNIKESYNKSFLIVEKEETREKEKLAKVNEKICAYSVFDTATIGEIIAILINTFEDEEYVYQETAHDKIIVNNNNNNNDDNWTSQAKFIVKMLVKKDKMKSTYKSTDFINIYIRNLEKEGSAIILSEYNSSEEEITRISFYNILFGDLNFALKLNGFEYIKDYINEVIKYRYQQNLDKDISKETLLNILDNFIKSKEKAKIKSRNKK